MSNQINTALLEKAADLIDTVGDGLWVDMAIAYIDSNDLQALANHINVIELEMDTQDAL